MAKYELKTKVNDKDVIAFLEKMEDEKKRSDSFELLDLFIKITNAEPKMWGENIIGFGSYQYKYDSGQAGEWFKIGFSPRKAKFSLYVMSGFNKLEDQLERLGKHKVGKSCLYVNKLKDIEISVLEELVLESFKHLKFKK